MGTALRWLGRGFLILAVALAALLLWQWDNFQRLALGGVRVYETTPPAFFPEIKHPAILVFSKTNGFRHAETITAANMFLANLAAKNGWGHFQTENGATFTPTLLARFDAVVFNNVSGDVFTPDQRVAFKSFLEKGGGFVGIHGSGGDFSYKWGWYVNDLIGAQFIGHIMNPQFQDAKLVFESRTHPAVKALPESLIRKDEWYSFDASVRKKGFNVIATLDEKSYTPKGMLGQELAMGDHPIIWSHCIGKGRVFYSAIGHLPEAYSEPAHQTLLAGAIKWAMRQDGEGCAPNTAAIQEIKK